MKYYKRNGRRATPYHLDSQCCYGMVVRIEDKKGTTKIRDCSRFFEGVGHKTTYASGGNHHLFQHVKSTPTKTHSISGLKA